MRLYRLTMKVPPHNLPPRYNVCPTDPVDVVTERDGNRDLVRMRWRTRAVVVAETPQGTEGGHVHAAPAINATMTFFGIVSDRRGAGRATEANLERRRRAERRGRKEPLGLIGRST